MLLWKQVLWFTWLRGCMHENENNKNIQHIIFIFASRRVLTANWISTGWIAHNTYSCEKMHNHYTVKCLHSHHFGLKISLYACRRGCKKPASSKINKTPRHTCAHFPACLLFTEPVLHYQSTASWLINKWNVSFNP